METARFFALRLLLLLALAFSAMLSLDAFTSGAATFCAESGASGCGAVRASALAAPLGVPLAYVGLAGFSLLFALTLGGARATKLLRLSLALAGAGGAGLLLYQWIVVGEFCELCVVVDVAAIAAALVGAAKPLPLPAKPSALPRPAWVLLGLLAVGAPAVYQSLPEPRPIPAFVEALYEDSGVTLVEVVDFGCTHCRALQREVAEAVEGKAYVTVRRIVAPITGHRLSQSASVIYRCAERHGVADEFAKLMADDEFFSGGVERWVAELGEVGPLLRSCMTERAIRDDVTEARREVREAGIDGIPMTYIGGTVLRGAVLAQRIEQVVRNERLGLSLVRPSAAVFVGAVLGLAALILAVAAVFSRRRAARA